MIGYVTATLSTPLLVDFDLHLDGLLAFVQAKRLGLSTPARSTSLADIPTIAIPIEAVEYGGHRVYLSTAAVYADTAPYRTRWTRRRDAHDVEALDGTFNPGKGPGRNMMVIAHGILTSAASWLIATPDLDAVMELLEDVRELGKVRRHGYGVVREWAYTSRDDIGARDILVHEGVAMRSLPVDWLNVFDEGAVRRLAVSLPYWHPETQLHGVGAGARVELRSEVLA